MEKSTALFERRLEFVLGGGTDKRVANAIIHIPTLSRMLRLYGSLGGWRIEFFNDANDLIYRGLRVSTLFVDSINELHALDSLGRLPAKIYFLGPDDDELAEQLEQFNVKALLTCPDHWP